MSRDRQGEKNRRRQDRIIHAAGRLFLSRGYDNVSMNDVAKEVELYESTLRLYFADKESLYFAVILRGARILDAMYSKRSAGETAGLLKPQALGRAPIDLSRRDPDDYRAIYRLPPARAAGIHNASMGALYEAIEACAEDGHIGPPELAIYLTTLSIGAFADDRRWRSAMKAGCQDDDRFAEGFAGNAIARGQNIQERQNDGSEIMVRINVKNEAEGGRIAEGKVTQVEVFPQRLLNIETAQKLMDALNEIGGIVRIVVYGPRLPAEDPENLLSGKFGVREKRCLDIKGEEVELTTQVGRIWIEVEDIRVKEEIRAACERALPFPFEIYEGLYMRRRKTVTDYARRGENVDDLSLGMFDPKDRRAKCCGENLNRGLENDQV